MSRLEYDELLREFCATVVCNRLPLRPSSSYLFLRLPDIAFSCPLLTARSFGKLASIQRVVTRSPLSARSSYSWTTWCLTQRSISTSLLFYTKVSYYVSTSWFMSRRVSVQCLSGAGPLGAPLPPPVNFWWHSSRDYDAYPRKKTMRAIMSPPLLFDSSHSFDSAPTPFKFDRDGTEVPLFHAAIGTDTQITLSPISRIFQQLFAHSHFSSVTGHLPGHSSPRFSLRTP